MSKQKQYISGHDVRRFFLISRKALRKLQHTEHARYTDKHYTLYELDHLNKNYRKRGEVPGHLLHLR